MNGFDDFDTQVTAEEFYAGWTEDEADYHADWKDEQAQEDADWRDLASMDTSGSYSYEEPDSWEDVAAQWDDDPSPYDGTYSEE